MRVFSTPRPVASFVTNLEHLIKTKMTRIFGHGKYCESVSNTDENILRIEERGFIRRHRPAASYVQWHVNSLLSAFVAACVFRC